MNAAAAALMATEDAGSITLIQGGQSLIITPGPIVRTEQRGARGRLERVWPIGRLLEPTPDGQWRSRPGWHLPDGRSWAEVFPCLPADLLSLVARFESRQWPLLEFANNCAAFRDLLRSNPALAYALACNGEFRNTTPEEAARRASGWAPSRQREIARALGFPAAEATVGLFRRILPEAATPSALRMLRGALPLPPALAKLLSHLPRLHAGVLAFVAQLPLRPAITPRLLDELAACGDELTQALTADLVVDTVRMGRNIPGWALTPISSRARARELHDRVLLLHLAEQERRRHEVAARWEAERLLRERQEQQHLASVMARLRAEEQRARDGAAFPPPPLPGTRHIEPIVSEPDLVLEGLLQKNCVGSFQDSVRSGDTYFYRVLAPERATLKVVREDGRGWVPKEVRLKANRAARAETVSAIRDWVAASTTRAPLASRRVPA